MKKQILKVFMWLTTLGTISGCGNSFLETDYYKGIDVETGLGSVDNISTALNGTYYRFFHYYFAGNYATNIGDIPTDISYWNTETGHWDLFYNFTFTDTYSYLNYIWNYGYKVADNSARVIKASKALYDSSSASEKTELDLCMAEAYALRAYAHLRLVNIYGHQVKVNGTDFSSAPGIVVVDEPIEAFAEISRSTVGKTYEAILSDLNNAISHFTAAGGDRESLVYFSEAAIYGLFARTYLYLENWDSAMQNAQKALAIAGITTLIYTDTGYKALYNSETSNTESLFALAITSSQNWSANSSGTLWSTYNYSPSPKLLSLYGAKDCRTAIFEISGTTTVPKFNGGKFAHFSSANSAYGTNYLINASEMFLIIAEANLKASSPSITNAQNALLTVAKRNAEITSTADLPSANSELMEFIKDERARELFQEGHRLFDLRRWDEAASVYAYGAPNIQFTFTNYKISDLIFPIPNNEITSGFGVEQNDGWANTLPK